MTTVQTLFPFQQMWTGQQIGMSEVVRWGKYRQVYPGIRIQPNTAHTMAFVWLVTMLIPLVRRERPNFDGELLLAAVNSHDLGEGILKQDVAYADKTASQDIKEYYAYVRSLEHLEPAIRRYAERAYLLQQVWKSWQGFPPQAITLLEELKATRPLEARYFSGCERYDYLCYALEHPAEHGMLIWVLRNNAEKLEVLAAQEPSFRNVVWTPAHSEWARYLLGEYEFFITEDDAVEEARLRAWDKHAA